MSGANIDAAVASGTLQTNYVAEPVPVLLAYCTAWVDAGGALHFRPDVYGRDAKVERRMCLQFPARAVGLTAVSAGNQ